MRRTAPIVLLVTLVVCGCGGGAGPSPSGGVSAHPELPAGDAQAPAEPGAPATPARAALPGPWTLARVQRSTALRTQPGGRQIATVSRRTEFGGPRVLSVVGRRAGWLEVVAPELPNGSTGWIPEQLTNVGATDLAVRVDLSAHVLEVRQGGRTTDRVPIGIGAVGHETPTGRFAVTDKLRMGGPGTTYGCCAIALSAHQPHLPQGWSGLDRIAVHGTRSPGTIGTASSLGCMHAGDDDLRRLMRTVPLGAPVFIRS